MLSWKNKLNVIRSSARVQCRIYEGEPGASTWWGLFCGYWQCDLFLVFTHLIGVMKPEHCPLPKSGSACGKHREILFFWLLEAETVASTACLKLFLAMLRSSIILTWTKQQWNIICFCHQFNVLMIRALNERPMWTWNFMCIGIFQTLSKFTRYSATLCYVKTNRKDNAQDIEKN